MDVGKGGVGEDLNPPCLGVLQVHFANAFAQNGEYCVIPGLLAQGRETFAALEHRHWRRVSRSCSGLRPQVRADLKG